MMQGPHCKYLTHSYVLHLGLDPFPLQRQDVTVVWIDETELIPLQLKAFDLAVVYNHMLYIREPDGLAWTLKPCDYVRLDVALTVY